MFKLIDKDNWKRKPYFDHYFSQINKTRNHRRGTTNDIFIYQRHIVYFRMMDRKIIFSISHVKIDRDFLF